MTLFPIFNLIISAIDKSFSFHLPLAPYFHVLHKKIFHLLLLCLFLASSSTSNYYRKTNQCTWKCYYSLVGKVLIQPSMVFKALSAPFTNLETCAKRINRVSQEKSVSKQSSFVILGKFYYILQENFLNNGQ